MGVKGQAPESLRGSAGARLAVRYKGNEFPLSKLQRSIFITLSDGQKHSSHKLMQQCKTSDPRKEVQYLRRKGINVQDTWVDATPTIPRHKLYFIDPIECSNE